MILGIVLIVAAVAAAYLLWPKSESETNYSFPVINKDTVDSVNIKNASVDFSLTKTDGQWKVNDQEIEAAKIDSFFSAFSGVNVTGPVSSSGKNFANFSLDDDSALKLTFKSGGASEVASLVIGKLATDYVSTYFKTPSDQNVYLVDRDWNTVVKITPEDWLVKE